LVASCRWAELDGGEAGNARAARPGADPDTFIEVIPYSETRGYVKTVQQSAAMYRWLYQNGHPSATQ